MKKMLCILLVALLLALISIPALAEGNDAEVNDPLVFDLPNIGFHFVTPEKYRNLNCSLNCGTHYLDVGMLSFRLCFCGLPFVVFDL